MAAALIMMFYIGQATSFISEGIEKTKTAYEEIEKKQQIITGYNPAWKSYSGYTPEKIDIRKLTHIN